MDFEFGKYYLMMTILVKSWINTQTHKVDTVHRFSLNASWFINNLLWSKLRSYGLNFRAFKGSYITIIPVTRLCVEPAMTKLKRDWLPKQRLGLAQSCGRSFQSHLWIGLETCTKKQSCKFYLQVLSQRLYIHEGN